MNAACKMVWIVDSHENGRPMVYRSECGRYSIVRPHYQGGAWTLYGPNGLPIAYGSHAEVKRIAAETAAS